jgi:hypothetical protein
MDYWRTVYEHARRYNIIFAAEIGRIVFDMSENDK